MRCMLLLAGLLVASSAAAQTPVAALVWDVDAAPTVVNSYTRAVTVDGAAVTASPTCVAATAPTTGTTCTLPVPSLATGTHTVVIRYTSGSQSVTNTTTGLTAMGTLPALPTNLRITVTVTVTVP